MSAEMKQLSIRIPVSLFKACLHRMVDDEIGWQELITGMLEKYAAGNPANAEKPSE